MTRALFMNNVFIHFIFKKTYLLFFPLLKLIKYPNTKIVTNWVHPSAKIAEGVVISKGCHIGANVQILNETFINSGTSIEKNVDTVGKFCSIGENVKIGIGSHRYDYISTSPKLFKDIPSESFFNSPNKTTIGNDVYIGSNVVIFAGVKISDGAVVGVGSLVTKDIPAYAIVCGMPARILRYRFSDDIIKKLQASEWWNLPLKKLVKMRENLRDPNKFLDELDHHL